MSALKLIICTIFLSLFPSFIAFENKMYFYLFLLIFPLLVSFLLFKFKSPFFILFSILQLFIFLFLFQYEIKFLIASKSNTVEYNKNIKYIDSFGGIRIIGDTSPIERAKLMNMGAYRGASCILNIPEHRVYYYIYVWKCSDYSSNEAEK